MMHVLTPSLMDSILYELSLLPYNNSLSFFFELFSGTLAGYLLKYIGTPYDNITNQSPSSQPVSCLAMRSRHF